MKRLLLNTGIALLVFLLAGFSLCRTASAQSPEELQVLHLFYKDKDLVVTPTRHPKPISQVAENMTVITAEEIEAMNAHTVAEVLNRVPGLFIDFNQDFGAPSQLSIQGSEPRHVLVLLDGIPWNLLSEGSAETKAIPPGIIERIEIIKGPASSAWGSSLGGVINILTKEADDMERPAGTVKASYGERNTQDYSAQVSGLAGPLGYYLFAGRRKSQGLRSDRSFDATSLFTKFNVSLTPGIDLGLSLGVSKPENNLGPFPSQDLTTASDDRSSFLSAYLDASLAPNLDLNFSVYGLEQKLNLRTDTLGLGIFSPTSQFFLGNSFDERSTGARGRLVWAKGIHTAVLGVDLDRGTLEQNLRTGPFPQQFGAPPASAVRPTVTKWALYANDTMIIDKWSLTPGIRYDYNSIIGSFVSPSLGATYKLGKTTLARASVARGFTQPPLSATSTGGLFLQPNPSLGNETIRSYQAGLESAALPHLWLKTTVFYHDLEHEMVRQGIPVPPPAINSQIVNKDGVKRRGLELEAQTVPVYDFSLSAGFAYARIDSDSDTRVRDRYTYNLGINYNDRKTLQAQLFGHYVWWNFDAAQGADYGDWVWDLNVSKKIVEQKQWSAGLFFTAHNLFNGAQYTIVDNNNPERWLEGGIKVDF